MAAAARDLRAKKRAGVRNVVKIVKCRHHRPLHTQSLLVYIFVENVYSELFAVDAVVVSLECSFRERREGIFDCERYLVERERDTEFFNASFTEAFVFTKDHLRD